MDLPGTLAEQLPVAVLFLLAAAAVARYAARLLDKLVAGQERVQAKLIDALERNTAAWRDTCAALASLESAVKAPPALPAVGAAGDGHGMSRQGGRGTPRRGARRRAALAPLACETPE